ncbi:AbrB/MazE/SpoVT family DNA-binding domain-containing protein [Albidovulum sediminis]|jgi:antitoxin PrlF|uniref:Type II toxin-antitoxin system PrlF family antitoxin n=1 Tax=Albidovulum sediminis TaxID=3066345 RepID=A0ABT2NRT0_9RHOB|nr:type II toxin-antitoxin system PrlF family antitoxin [Defluviimonas sediminis]MCT8331660.1 type II toxin-antitoxin system PrlF family antitoxin [Defluviimonas sediminis]
MQESTVTTKGQTTLPKDVRTALKLHPGDRVRYMILDGGEVRLVRSRPVMQLAGLLKDRTDKRATLEEIEEAIANGASGQ